MYTVTLLLHSWLRWIVILLGMLAFVRAVTGRFGGRAWTIADAAPGRLYGRALDLQMLLGLLLYFVFSNILGIARADIGRAMASPAIRFWLVEHLIGMLVAISLAHVGAARSVKASTDERRFGQAALFYGLSLLALFMATPWPGLPYGRPLLRFL
jgi:hypothetical protein